uniref:carboxypeptidase-like regulatory domain-containing protein n=1 Tax=Granulicella cerasi TaxID=741063 RepID=UPI0036F33F0F
MDPLCCCSDDGDALYPRARATGCSAAAGPSATIRASVLGNVVDEDNDVVPESVVTLSQPSFTRSVMTAADGTFSFAEIPAGSYTLTVAKAEWAPVTRTVLVSATGSIELGAIAFTTPTARFEVSAMTQHQISEIEVKQAEKQRLLGVLPNFGVTYNWDAPPLDAAQKFELATRFVIDPVSIGLNFGTAGIGRINGGYSSFGPGAKGYFKLVGAFTLDSVIGNELSGAVLPVIFKQDPRYFYRGTGTPASRTWYAITRTVICRSDKGKSETNYSNIIGSFASGAISNLYYPSTGTRGATLTLENGLIALGSNAAGNIVQEFLFKRFTPKAKRNLPTDDAKR